MAQRILRKVAVLAGVSIAEAPDTGDQDVVREALHNYSIPGTLNEITRYRSQC